MRFTTNLSAILVFLLLATLLDGYIFYGQPAASGQVSTAISQWSQFHGDATHSGFSSSQGPGVAFQAWSKYFYGSSDGLIAVNGMLIVSNPHGGGVSALSEVNGSYLFGYSGTCGLGSTYPAAGSGLVFLVSNCISPMGLLADELYGGANFWSTGVDFGQFSQSYGYHMDTYYNYAIYDVPFNTSIIASYNAATGKVIWRDSLIGRIDTVPTIGDGIMLVGFSSMPMVEAIDVNTGISKWNFTTDALLSDTPAFSDNTFFFGTASGTFYAVSTSGARVWVVHIGSEIETTPAVGERLVFFGTDNGYLYAFNSTTGVQVWSSNLGSAIISPPVLSSNNIVYEGTISGMIYALDALNGKVIWSYSLRSPVISSPVLDNGYLFVVDRDGVIHAFSSAYNVVFKENGLPSGTKWQVTLGSQTKSSTNSTITFLVPDGVYSYTVASVQGYSASPSSGTLTVSGSNLEQQITFSKNSVSVIFLESGLPDNLTWSVTLDNVKHISSSPSIIFDDVPNGFHTYTVGPPFGYQASPASGNFSVAGQNVTISISFGLGWNLPSPPQNVTAIGAVGLIQLSWLPPKSSGAPPGFIGTGIEYYYIYRGSAPGNESYYDKVPGNVLSYTDSSVTPGKIYFYEVAAVNPVGQSARSNEVSAQAVLITVPSTMSPVVATTEGNGIFISWRPPSSNGGAQITGYILCRGTSPTSTTTCWTLPANSTSYKDTNDLSPGQTYYYTIKALNQQGAGEASSPAAVVAPESIPGTPWWENTTNLTIIGIAATVLATIGSTFALRQRRHPELEIYFEKGAGWKLDRPRRTIDLVIRNAGEDVAIDVMCRILTEQGQVVDGVDSDSLEVHSVIRKAIQVSKFPNNTCRVIVTYKHPSSGKKREVNKVLRFPETIR